MSSTFTGTHEIRSPSTVQVVNKDVNEG